MTDPSSSFRADDFASLDDFPLRWRWTSPDRSAGHHVQVIRSALILGSSLLASAIQAQAPGRAAQPTTATPLFVVSDATVPDMLSDVRDVEFDAAGRLWVLEHASQSILLFSPTGTFERQVSRRGRGPGEFLNANGLQLSRAGHVIARDHGNGRIAFLDSAGRPAGQRILPSRSFTQRWQSTVTPDDHVLELNSAVREDGRSRRVIVRIRPDGGPVDTLPAPTDCTGGTVLPSSGVEGPRGIVGIPWATTILRFFTADGRFWCGRSDDYTFRRFDLGSDTPSRVISRTLPRLPIPRAARDSAIAHTESLLARIGRQPDALDRSRVPRDRSPVLGIAGDDVGRVWVMRETSAGQLEFDVWDSTADRHRTISVARAAAGVQYFRVRGDRLAIVSTDRDGVPEIAVFEVGR